MLQSQEKIARLEQEKEHWLLEAQLGRVRLEKETQRISELEAQLSAALGGATSATAAVATTAHEVPSTSGLHDQECEEKGASKETTSTSLVSVAS